MSKESEWGHSMGAAPRALNLERESCEHLRWTHLEQLQHCADLPHQVTFPAHTAGKDGARVGMNVTAHQEKEKNEETKTGKRRAGEERRPILRKLCAALLRSFSGQHSEKMKESARGNWDPREVQQPFRPNPNGVGDRTITLRRLLIGAGSFNRF